MTLTLSLTELLPLIALFTCIFALALVLRHVRNTPPAEEHEEPSQPIATVPAAGVVRRRRGGLARMRRAVAEEDSDTDAQQAPAIAEIGKRKKKKEANKEAKREAQQARQAALEHLREQEAEADLLRAEEEEQEREEQEQEEEEQKKADEEKAKKEQEEYENWKDLISVEDSGEVAEKEQAENPAMLEKFCSYIRENKIVILEVLAGEFDLKTEDAIDRLVRLEEQGEMTGFFDDRGKFIYVSKEEMQDVARFINRRGRISIQELAVHSSRLLHLDVTSAV